MENIPLIDKIFSPGNTIQIIFSQYIGSFKSFTATVKTLNEDGLYIATSETQIFNLLESGMEITIQYKDFDGKKYLFGTYKVANIAQDTSVLILAKPWKINSSLLHRYFDPIMETPWKVHSSSLRRYFRVKVDLPFYYSFDGIIHIGQIIDLSISGLFAVVHPTPRFSLGSTMTFQLQLPHTELFELKGEIVRSQTIENTKTGVGINFLEVPSNIRNEIAGYLLEKT